MHVSFAFIGDNFMSNCVFIQGIASSPPHWPLSYVFFHPFNEIMMGSFRTQFVEK